MDNHPPDVCRDHVLKVLAAFGVQVDLSKNGDIPVYTLSKDDIIDAQPFTPRVRRRILGRLAAKFGIGLTFFFQDR